MRCLWTLLACGLLATTALAQEPTSSSVLPREISLGELEPTPEMWFYQEALRLYQDPEMMVRARAEFRADQRQRRIESRKWFGYSNSRPVANPTPFMGSYSPAWVSNTRRPYDWAGVGAINIHVRTQVVRPDAYYGLW